MRAITYIEKSDILQKCIFRVRDNFVRGCVLCAVAVIVFAVVAVILAQLYFFAVYILLAALI